MCGLSASTSGALGFQALITLLAWKCASLLPLDLCRSLSREVHGQFSLVFGLRNCFPKVFRKKMIILFLCHLGLSQATFQACLLKLQPVFCKSSTLSRRHLDSPSLSLRCGDYYTFWSFRSTYPYLSGKFQRYTKVELAHVLAIQL